MNFHNTKVREADLPKPEATAYDPSFRPTDDYIRDLPDTQNLRSKEIAGSAVPIQEVGSSNFRLPLRFSSRNGEERILDTRILGAVSLSADRKGINMSRIIRVFYEYRDEVMSFALLHRILREYLDKLDSQSARIRLSFSYPILQDSLRSNLAGYQYYDCVMESRLTSEGVLQSLLQVDFVYSSACPCSSDLSEHARENRSIYSIPHSQRSRARVKVLFAPGQHLAIEDVVEYCQNALMTETQVMVRRPDEQAFAELNGTFQKFVEDAVRLIYRELDQDVRIAAFSVACSHLESLHSHDAVALLSKGLPTDLWGGIEEYSDLIC